MHTWTCQTTRALNTNLHPPVSIHYHWRGCETRLLKVERDTHRNAHTHVLSRTHPQIQADNENNKQRQLFKSVWQLKTTSVYFYLGIWHRWNFILNFCQIFWPCKDVLLFLIFIKSLWIFVVFSHLIVWWLNVRILCGHASCNHLIFETSCFAVCS